MQLKKNGFVTIICSLLVSFSFSMANDWPTYMHDNRRSGVTLENLPENLYLQWQYSAQNSPAPAWPEPAETDYWHREADLKPRVVYDKAFHVVSSGANVFFGSSGDDKLYCLDAMTGAEKWSFFADGPIRLAPTVVNASVIFGSDDGSVYCLNSQTGKVEWTKSAGENKRKILGNERMISISPVRTGVLVENNTAYFAAGLFPNEGVELFALNIQNGSELWKQTNLDISPQGFLLASQDKLYVPTGRTTPVVFSRSNGKQLGRFDGHGGVYALLHEDELVYGGGDLGTLNVKSENAKDLIASFDGLQMIVQGNIAYLRADGEISAVKRDIYFNNYKKWSKISEKKNDLATKLWDLRERRKLAAKDKYAGIDSKIENLVDEIFAIESKQQQLEDTGILWKYPVEAAHSMILAGEKLVVGGHGKLFCLDSKTGKPVWTESVDGAVYGLAVANGRLFASTDNGAIFCFAASKRKPESVRPPKLKNVFDNNGNAKEYAKSAQAILAESGIRKGYCLVVDSENGHLVYELAKQSELQIIGIEDDLDNVQKSRRLLDEAGLYGSRVSIVHGDLQRLPFTKYFANLVVVDNSLQGKPETLADEIERVVRPYGGVALVQLNETEEWYGTTWEPVKDRSNWRKFEKGRPENAGEWTHLYANPANTSCSLDPLKAPLQIQWFGRPGPRQIINRHSRPMSTLFKDGRLFIPANNRVISVDAYNGTLLWENQVPNSRILGALKDCGHMAVTTDLIYVASEDNCQGFCVVDGTVEATLKAPQLFPKSERDWGYLAVVDEQIFGSGKKKNASFTVLGRFNCDQFEGDFREMVMSDYLFSLDRKSGAELWRYKNGVVFNNTITIGGDYLYLVESRNQKAISDLDGRLRVDEFCESGTFLIKLDRKTGAKMWEKSVEFPFSQIMYLSNSKGVLLVTGSYNKGKHVHYGLYAFNADTGAQEWQQSFQGGNSRWDNSESGDTIGGSHGEQWQHPVIIENSIYLPPYNFDLATGKRGDNFLTRGGGGCGGLSGSSSFLFARGSNPRIYDITNERERGTPITRVNRPGCWINIIPAGNLVSIPESSSGCTCDYPIQTSFVFVPQNEN